MDEDIAKIISEIISDNKPDNKPDNTSPDSTSVVPYSEELKALQNISESVERFPQSWGLNRIRRRENGEVYVADMSSPESRRVRAVADCYKKNKAVKHYLYAHMPILCKGDDCPYDGCVYYQAGDVALGEPCIQEIVFILNRYEAIIEAAGVDPQKAEYTIDMMTISDLIYSYLLVRRLHAYLGKTPLITIAPVAVDNHGNPIDVEVENKAVGMLNNIHKHILKLEDSLQLSRKSKASGVSRDIDIQTILLKAQEVSNSIDDPRYTVINMPNKGDDNES